MVDRVMRPRCIIALYRRSSLVLAMFACTACQTVESVHTFVPDAAAIADPRLLGMWRSEPDGELAIVTQGGPRDYHVTFVDGRDTTTFSARLGRLDSHTLLDFSPTKSGDWQIPAHVAAVIELSDDRVILRFVSGDTIKQHLERGRLRVPHMVLDNGDIVLTAGTAELNRTLGPFLSRPGALDSIVWKRVAVVPELRGDVAKATPCFEPSAWREADLLFQQDPHWLGADVASTVDLGNGRTLWLFGDTWISASGSGQRKGARMISNSVAIQTGANPAAASMAFRWGRDADGLPAPLFPDRGAEALWFGNGVRVADRLVLFFARTVRTNTGVGFEHVGWAAVLVENPDDDPSAWRVRALDTPVNPVGILVGGAAVLKLDGFVYAFGSQNPVKSHPIYAARWPVEEVRQGRLLQPEWWAGERVGWVADSSTTPRWPLFENGRSELSIHVDPVSGRFVGVQSVGIGPADVNMRSAPTLIGPWTQPQLLYRPPEYYRPHVTIYAAKAHPTLTGGDLVLTYATNTTVFAEQLSDSTIYYPRFVRLTRCR